MCIWQNKKVMEKTGETKTTRGSWGPYFTIMWPNWALKTGGPHLWTVTLARTWSQLVEPDLHMYPHSWYINNGWLKAICYSSAMSVIWHHLLPNHFVACNGSIRYAHKHVSLASFLNPSNVPRSHIRCGLTPGRLSSIISVRCSQHNTGDKPWNSSCHWKKKSQILMRTYPCMTRPW